MHSSKCSNKYIWSIGELTEVVLDVSRRPVLPLEVHQLVLLALLDGDEALPLVGRHQVGRGVQVHLARLEEGDECA